MKNRKKRKQKRKSNKWKRRNSLRNPVCIINVFFAACCHSRVLRNNGEIQEQENPKEFKCSKATALFLPFDCSWFKLDNCFHKLLLKRTWFLQKSGQLHLSNCTTDLVSLRPARLLSWRRLVTRENASNKARQRTRDLVPFGGCCRTGMRRKKNHFF